MAQTPKMIRGRDQFQTYQEQIPSLFVHNAVLVISDGLEARVGAIRADKERFMPWRTIEGETLAPASLTQLEVLLRGVFDKRRFLDFVRYFIVFEDNGGNSVIKKIAGYHQFHAVNTAVAETIRAAGVVLAGGTRGNRATSRRCTRRQACGRDLAHARLG
jgi:type I restriction enzyme, R subunit